MHHTLFMFTIVFASSCKNHGKSDLQKSNSLMKEVTISEIGGGEGHEFLYKIFLDFLGGVRGSNLSGFGTQSPKGTKVP